MITLTKGMKVGRAMSKKIVMIAGPNGSGKTTIARSMITRMAIVDEFINADEIAQAKGVIGQA